MCLPQTEKQYNEYQVWTNFIETTDQPGKLNKILLESANTSKSSHPQKVQPGSQPLTTIRSQPAFPGEFVIVP